MLHKLFTLLAILLPMMIMAQDNDTINQLDSRGLKKGYWEKRTSVGDLVYQGYFKNGKPNGEMRRFYQTGELKAIMRYTEGSDKVSAVLFYNDGEPAGKGNYVNNQKDSLWAYYSFYSGAVTSTEMYSRGQKHGTEKKFYANGQVSEEIEWSMNAKHGKWNQYFEDGTQKLFCYNVFGKVSGSYLFYWPNGNLYMKGQFVDNKRHGKWIFNTDEGQLKYEIVYHYGKAENEDEIEEKDKEFFRMVDENIGRFTDPSIEDVMPGSGSHY